MRRAALVLVVCLSALGCGATTDRCPARTAVAVPSRPPAPLPEAQQKAPTPDMEWVAGEWTWDDAHWTWVPGHWLGAPADTHWERGKTFEDGNGRLVFRPAGWSCPRD